MAEPTLAGLRLLADENIAPAFAAMLRKSGFDVHEVRTDPTLQGMPDASILAYANSTQRYILTHDSDFGRLALQGHTLATGVFYLRPGTLNAIDNFQKFMAFYLTQFHTVQFPALVTIQEGKVRVRVL